MLDDRLFQKRTKVKNMKMRKAPSWPIVITSGLAGGATNWWFDSNIIAFSVFVITAVILALIVNHRKKMV